MGGKRKTAQDFGRWLDTTMANESITGRDLARKVGVHDSIISRWRSGAGTPGIDSCARLADALQVDPLRLAVTAGLMDRRMAGVEALPMPPAIALRERVREQIAAIKGLTDQSRQALLDAYDKNQGLEDA